nr:EOG090X00BV [Ceriodaphnia reticulata]
MLSRKQNSIHFYPESVTFGFHTAEDIRKISVVQITNPESFNALGHPTTGGLYDKLMGPADKKDGYCGTCHLQVTHCPGHYGHIELPLPCFHPLFLRNVANIMKLTCPVCKCFFASERKKMVLAARLELLRYGLITDAQQFLQVVNTGEHDEDEGSEAEEEGASKPASEEADENLRIEISEAIQRMKEDAGVNFVDEPAPTRNVENLRQMYIKGFLKKLAGKNKCGKCKGGWQRVVLYKSRIVYSLTAGTVSTAVGGSMLAAEIPEEEEEEEEEEEKNEDGSKKKKTKKVKKSSAMMYMTPQDARDHFRLVWRNDREMFGHLYPVLKKTKIEHPTDVFFLQVIPVIPPKFRPTNVVNSQVQENGQTSVLRKIVTDNFVVKAALYAQQRNSFDSLPPDSQRLLRSLQGTTLLDKLQNAWQNLQQNVNLIADTAESKEAASLTGFRQIMEKKEGLFRMHMMGKRVNFAARSVITPDPNLDVEEVGVPDCFAKKLTYPTPVTSWNVYELRDSVRNGPAIYPGAVAIEDSNGKVIMLNEKDPTQREAVAKTLLTPSEAIPKIVHRHLKSGDILLLNRQPTLHKPSIMAHKARVLMGEKTLRLHYANCKAYNADFDGDEMNAHFPQNEVARAEAYNIVAVPYQYLVPKDGTPLSGLIQDHMISGVKLTMRGQFFNRSDYQQLVFAGLGGREYNGATKLLPPTILKPVPLWSGKQILSTIITNLTPKGKPLINMNSTAKISVKDWQSVPPRQWKAGGTPLANANSMTESEVIIRHGELLVGVLDKMHYGSTSYGLIHAFSELYGGRYSCRLLSSFSRLFTTFLQLRGFTLGVEDILVTPKADKKRKKIINRLKTIGDSTAARAVGIDPEQIKTSGMKVVYKKMEEAHFSRSTLKRMTIDREYKSETDKITNEVNKACIPGGLHRIFPDNNLSLMIQSGAKGSSVNAMQISCLLGQIELEGKRPPLMISGRSLPSFVAYDTSPRAGGFIAGRFMTGIRPQEFFFHCMAGREGLIDTAVKTSRSGYLQRCLVKHLEGVSVAYDHTVRDSDGLVLQFLYGEDGLDIGKSQYLNEKGIPFLVDNRECVRLADVSVSDVCDQKEVNSAQKAVKRWLKKHGSLRKQERKSGFLNFSTQCEVEIQDFDIDPRVGRSLMADEIEKAWRAMSLEERAQYSKKQRAPPDPVNALYSFARNIDVFDEHLNEMMSRYLERPDANIGRKELTRLVYSKAVAASCEPGEPVGVLAAQSIGEPSTQMTLNTFHFAGRGEMNVTLGIPRLREILTVASANIQTPSMDIPLLIKGPKALRKAQKLKLLLTKVTLSDVLENVEVTERLSVRDRRSRIYGFTFKFLPHSSYKDRFCVKPKQILQYFETRFVGNILLPGMRREAAAQSLQSLFVSKSASQVRATATNEEEDLANKTEGEETVKAEGRGKKSNNDGDEDEEDESDAGEEDDADFNSSNQRAKHADEHEYEEDEDKDVANKKAVVDEGFGEDDDESLILDEAEEEDENGQVKKKKKKKQKEVEEVEKENEAEEEMTVMMEEAVESRKNAMLDRDPWIVDYEFDINKSLSCRLTLSVPLSIQKVDMSSALKKWAELAIVHQVPKIKRAFVVVPKSDDEDVIIKTDGVNINAMFDHADILDLNRLYCNDIHAVVAHYGVEAASRVIVKEVNNVFKVYGITVDPRHLSLVASFMTSGGGYRAFSRVGMADCTSPLQQMTYETATEFLKNATLQGKTDFLKTPSSRLVLGLPGLEGTGSFGLLQKLY